MPKSSSPLPVLEYKIPDGKRLLAVSRAAKDRVLLLGLIYRLTGDERFANRLWKELDTVTHFKDWNPSHFLDTAEMTFAVAIGYDWLYDTWSSAAAAAAPRGDRTTGARTKALPIYQKQSWWSRPSTTGTKSVTAAWRSVRWPSPTRSRHSLVEILHQSLTSLPRAMHEFGPDGGWGEGPGYWRYATEYNVYLLAALNTALGHDFGLSQMPGFSETGDFPIYFTGPTGQTFNYADAHSGWRGAPQLFWLATVLRPARLGYSPRATGERVARRHSICSGAPTGSRGRRNRIPCRSIAISKASRSSFFVAPGTIRKRPSSALKAATIASTTANSTSAALCSTPLASAGSSISARTITTCPGTLVPAAGIFIAIGPKVTTPSS